MNLSKFASRKLSVTVLTVGGLIAAKAYAEAAAVAVSYVTTQGVIDHAAARKASSVLGTLDEVVEAVRRELQPAPVFVPVPDIEDFVLDPAVAAAAANQ